MSDYFARVELHGAPWPTGYQKLHEALAVHNFTNCIVWGRFIMAVADRLLPRYGPYR
jgi:hypothetical protein